MHYDKQGRRKYLTARERSAFIQTAATFTPEVETLCLTLIFTGARLSEALALTPSRVDHEVGLVSIKTLKQRKKDVSRQLLLPPALLLRLRSAHESVQPGEPLWWFGRTTAWNRVKTVMLAAGIDPIRCTARVLRHTFCVYGLHVAKIPPFTMMELMGHAKIETTLRYSEIVGEEARELFERMW